MSLATSQGTWRSLKPKWEDAHPWLFSAAVILALGAQNVEWFTLGDVLAVVAPTMMAATMIFLVTLFLRRSARHAALLSTWVSLLILYYGTMFDGLAKIARVGGAGLCHLVLIAIGVGVTAVIWHLSGELKSLSKFLSVTATITLSVFSAKLGIALARESSPSLSNYAAALPARIDTNSEATQQPDIYYIILDGYGRSDVLQQFYDFDNSKFLDGLNQRGFYVADKSCTNYPGTAFSLSSSLNMRYHESFSPAGGYKSLAQLLRTHEVGRQLRDCGYQLIHFNTSFVPTACSDISHIALGEPIRWLPGGSRMMLMQLVRHSAGRFVCGGDKGLFAAQHRRALRQLADVPTLPGPKFTFCHLVTPHPPYVFKRDGQTDWNLDQHDRTAYLDQVLYLNDEVTKAVDAIIAKSATPPIIIIQSDHGPGFSRPKPGSDSLEEYVQERVPILNAYLVPESVRESLYPTITPVNSFRLLLSKCFGFDYAPLPDRNFLVHRAIWPNILEVTRRVHNGTPEPGLLSPDVVSRTNALAKKDAVTSVE